MTNTNVEPRNLNSDWKIAERFTLAEDSRVVTIKARNVADGNVGAILASFSNNVVTDETWQCSNRGDYSYHVNNDSNWQAAITYGYNNEHASHIWIGVNQGKPVEGIKQTAQWIWVNDSTATAVWCRKTFGE